MVIEHFNLILTQSKAKRSLFQERSPHASTIVAHLAAQYNSLPSYFCTMNRSASLSILISFYI